MNATGETHKKNPRTRRGLGDLHRRLPRGSRRSQSHLYHKEQPLHYPPTTRNNRDAIIPLPQGITAQLSINHKE